ncbi:hypothetical protein SBOR_5388 [Sclerotinia borealis F-4128]|uniref:Ubiquitin-like domain-containing protein n=1 Tax=Sclerotinia borealis (strain F-4128) TaxID=1432307 RepID=W9CHR8_SCLBF|nr:hypothetical protein SBOR_5388 [Sclerotinia borealis F-4128]
MPESNQSSSPPPAYIHHVDIPATHIGVLNMNSEEASTVPTTLQTAPTSHEIVGNQVPATQPVNKQNVTDLTTPAPAPGSNAAGSLNTSSATLLSTLEQAIQRLELSQEDRLITRLETVLSRQAEVDTNLSSGKRETRKPIKLKDAVGRRFSFPYHRCETWAGIEELIKSAFLHVDIIGPHVNEGHYDIMNPAGEVILPQLWEDHVQPGWEISMSMWPISGPKPRFPQPAPNAPVHVIVDRLPGPPFGPPPPCFRSHFPPRYDLDSDSIASKKKGILGIWQKMKGIFTKKRTNYDSDSSSSLCDD